MKRPVAFSSRATEALERLYLDIARRASTATARHLVQDIEIRCALLEDFPMLGRARDDLSAGLRVLSLDRRFTIAYRIEPRRVLIAMVFVRGQDFEAAMRGPQPD